jgi:outer membrane immunogenic protein
MSQLSNGQGQTGMNIRQLLQSILIIVLGMCAGGLFASTAWAQSGTSPLEAGADYNYVRANGPPGGCGCFSMNGGNAWFSYGFTKSFSAVA